MPPVDRRVISQELVKITCDFRLETGQFYMLIYILPDECSHGRNEWPVPGSPVTCKRVSECSHVHHDDLPHRSADIGNPVAINSTSDSEEPKICMRL